MILRVFSFFSFPPLGLSHLSISTHAPHLGIHPQRPHCGEGGHGRSQWRSPWIFSGAQKKQTNHDNPKVNLIKKTNKGGVSGGKLFLRRFNGA